MDILHWKQAVYNCEANHAMYDELFTRVKRFLTNRLHGVGV